MGQGSLALFAGRRLAPAGKRPGRRTGLRQAPRRARACFGWAGQRGDRPALPFAPKVPKTRAVEAAEDRSGPRWRRRFSMLRENYPYYLANRAVYANRDLPVIDKYTAKVA